MSVLIALNQKKRFLFLNKVLMSEIRIAYHILIGCRVQDFPDRIIGKSNNEKCNYIRW
jgi:hypothetical protein